MKYFIQICLVSLFIFSGCKSEKTDKKEVKETKQEVVYDSFGAKISLDKAITFINAK